MNESKPMTLAQLLLQEEFEQAYCPPRPKFSVTENVETQNGFFWREKEVTQEMVRFFKSVGQVQCGDEGIGTAFALKTEGGIYFVSALHPFEQKDLYGRLSITFGDLKIPLSRKGLKAIEDRDVVLIKASENVQVQPLEIGNKETMAGETVITIGFPNGYLRYRYLDSPVLSIGKLLELNENKFRANLRSEKGCSGSPLITPEGKVIGILLESLETNNETVTYVRGRKDYRGQVISRGTPLTTIFS